jgi:Rrf2 family protein
MHLSRAATYAVHALARLAAGDDPAASTARGLAPYAGAPGGFLSKTLRPLIHARLLVSVKGPHGGYLLARPAARITLLEILEAVEGPLDNHGTLPPDSADPAFDRRIEAACQGAAEAQRRRLARVRLSDLAGGR